MKPNKLGISILAIALSGILMVLVMAFEAPYVKKERLLYNKENQITTMVIATMKASPEEEAFLKERRFVLLKRRAQSLLSAHKVDESLKLLKWIRERYDEDTQIDQNLAAIEAGEGRPQNAKQYYDHILEKSTKIDEISEAISFISASKPESYVKGVREFIQNYNKGDRFKVLLEKKPYSMDDETWILLMALETVEGRESELAIDSTKYIKQHIGSFHLKDYVYEVDGKVSLDFKRLRNDLVGENNPQRKPLTPGNMITQATMLEMTSANKTR